MKILITGHMGFIGSWLTFFLAQRGHDIYGIDNRSSYGDRLYDKANLSDLVVHSAELDITSIKEVAEFVNDVRPDLVIHLAAQAIIPRAFADPVETYLSNAVGTLSIVEACKSCANTKAIVSITSDKVYTNNNDGEVFTEQSEIGGSDVYSISKSAAEMICKSYALTHASHLNIQTVRLGNVVGGGDWSINRLMPDLIAAANTNQVFEVRYENATRPFQHISDVVSGVTKIALSAFDGRLVSGDSWNLGPRNNTFAYVRDVISGFKQLYPSLEIQPSPTTLKEDMRLSVDVTKYQNRFSEPKYTSQTSIDRAMVWYEGFHTKNECPRNLMGADLEWIEG